MIDQSQLESLDEKSADPFEEAIRLRSKEIWEREGCTEGLALEHWLRAKAELEAEREHWTRVKAELAAEVEKTSTEHLTPRRKSEFLGSIRAQASTLMAKVSRPAVRSTAPYSHQELDDIERKARALPAEDIAPLRRSDVSVPRDPPSLPPTITRRSKQTAGAPSIISADLVMRGTLESAGDIHLDGCVEGNVRSEILVVGDTAVINGEVIADDVTVRGCILGGIRARKVLLCAGSRIKGNILYGIFEAEAGAQIEGNCRYVDDPLAQGLILVEADAPPKDAALCQSAA